MKLKFTVLIIVATALYTLVSCKKSANPYVSKSVIDSLIARQNPAVKNVAFIFKNDVYYLPAFDKEAVKITNTPTAGKKFIKMSHNAQKFAFLNSTNRIEIIDKTGKQLTVLTQYSQVKSFDWSNNDETLYILNNNSMVYYGPSMNLPEIRYGGSNSYSNQVLSASVSAKGDFAYVFYAFNPFGLDYYKLIIAPANDTKEMVITSSEQSDQMAYVAFSSNEQDLVVGIKPRITFNNKLLKLLLYTDLKKYPDYTISESSYQAYSTPKYNSSQNYMVCGYMQNKSDSVKLHAYGFEKYKEKHRHLAQYYNTGDVIYTDWK